MSRHSIPHLTEDEIALLIAGQEDPSVITDYFFRKPGRPHGWVFDYNFDPEGAWQNAVHKAKQKRIIVIGGFGSGKTRGIAMSACVWCMTTTDFAFMNCAPKAWQSELMYRFIIDQARNTPFERLIYEFPKRPYPKIELRFYVRNILVVSTMEFMSIDKNASAILSWEGDWVNIDEAGQLDELEESLKNLGTRLRGSINGRSRLGRMSLTSNSWDNPTMWQRFDMATSDPESFLSIVVSTRHNHNVDEEQLRLMLKDIPEDEHQRYIDGTRPEGRGNYFSRNKVYACEDSFYSDFIVDRFNEKVPGYEVQVATGLGVVYFQIPRQENHYYMLLGDPGTGDAPNRNAPVLMVWDVTNFPKVKATLAAFWWGFGGGSINPFIRKMLDMMAHYNPVYSGVDSTGPQKNTNELLNTYLFGARASGADTNWISDVDLSKVTNLTIGGMDFSTGHKPTYLVAARLMIEAGLMIWPKFAVGIRSQLTNYDPAKDRVNEPKIAQDIVSTLCMSAYAIRVWFNINPAEAYPDAVNQTHLAYNMVSGRDARLSDGQRTTRIARPTAEAEGIPFVK